MILLNMWYFYCYLNCQEPILVTTPNNVANICNNNCTNIRTTKFNKYLFSVSQLIVSLYGVRLTLCLSQYTIYVTSLIILLNIVGVPIYCQYYIYTPKHTAQVTAPLMSGPLTSGNLID